MSNGPNGWFEPRLTLDGLMTLAAGIIAFVAVLLQNCNTRRQIDRQLKAEKKAREDEAAERRRAVATGLLFEIDSIYRQFVLALKQHCDSSSFLPIIWPISADRIAIYRGNTGHIGELPVRLVAPVVEFYTAFQSFCGNLNEYSQRYAAIAQTNDNSKAIALWRQVEDALPALADRAYFACGILCEYTRTEFSAPGLAVVSDPMVSEETHAALRDLVGIMQAEAS